MQCLTASELMSLRLDAALSEEDERELDAHLSTCPVCQHEWELMQRACQAFVGVDMAEPSPQFTAQVMERVQRRAVWMTVLRGGLSLLLVAVILTTLAVIPLRAVFSMSETVAGTPALISTVVGAVVSLGDVLRTLCQAIHLVMQSLFASPTWLAVLGYLIVCGIVALGWAKLVLLPRRLDS